MHIKITYDRRTPCNMIAAHWNFKFHFSDFLLLNDQHSNADHGVCNWVIVSNLQSVDCGRYMIVALIEMNWMQNVKIVSYIIGTCILFFRFSYYVSHHFMCFPANRWRKSKKKNVTQTMAHLDYSFLIFFWSLASIHLLYYYMNCW